MKKILFFFLSLFFLLPGIARAADLNIDCTGTGCGYTGSSPLFSDPDGLWYPGRLLSKTFNLKNSDSLAHDMGFEARRSSSVSILEDVLSVSIVGPSFLWAGHLANLYSAGEIVTGNFAPDANADYTVTVSMDIIANNSTQDRRSNFDLVLGFHTDTSPTSTPTPTPPTVINPPSGIYLNEIMAAPPDNQEWVELYNSNSYSVTLIGWQFDDIEGGGQSPKNLGTINIPAGSYSIIQLGSNYLNNDGDSARLINNLGIQVDIFSFVSTTSTESWSKQSDLSWCSAVPSKNIINNLCLGTPTSTPTPTTGGGGGSGGGVSGATCGEPAPGGAPTLTSAIVGTNQITLTWTEAVPPLTYYLLAFGTSPGSIQYGNPNVGGQGTTSYTVTNLSAGVTYYFRIRAGNGCAPGPYSDQLSAVPSGVVLAVVNPSGFQEGVLGVSETLPAGITPTPSESPGAIAGLAATTSPKWPVFLITLLLLLLLLVLLYLALKKK